MSHIRAGEGEEDAGREQLKDGGIESMRFH